MKTFFNFLERIRKWSLHLAIIGIILFGFLLPSSWVFNIDFDQDKFSKQVSQFEFNIEFIKFRLETLQNTILFWAILFFTCIIGIIELLPEIKIENNWLQICLRIIYFAMVFVIDFCIFRVWSVVLESALLSRVTVEEWKPFTQYIGKHFSDFDSVILNPILSRALVIVLMMSTTLLFILIYYYKTTNEVNKLKKL